MPKYVKILTSETMIMEEINRVKHIKVLMSTVPSFNRRKWQRREHFYAIKTILISCSMTPVVNARNFLANLIINSIMYGIYNLRNTWHLKSIIIIYFLKWTQSLRVQPLTRKVEEMSKLTTFLLLISCVALINGAVPFIF